MGVEVDLHLVTFGVLGVLAVMCGLIQVALRKGSALAWLTAAMVSGSVETLVMRFDGRSPLEVAAITLIVPAELYFVSQAIRLSQGMPRTRRPVLLAAGAMTMVSLLILAASGPSFGQTLPFQIAGIAIFLDTIVAVARRRDRSLLDHSLLLLLCLMFIGDILRLPLFSLLLDLPVPFPILSREAFQRIIIPYMSMIAAVGALLIVARIVSNVIADYRDRSERDDLTHLLNRGAFDRALGRPAEETGAVVLCDIDHFKAVNDRYGHAVGDDVIRAFARMLRRHGEDAARIGGEEFALLLPGASLEIAAAKADAIREYFQAFRHPSIEAANPLSASFGVAIFVPGQDARTALVRADQTLYGAKNAGRNRVSIAASAETAPGGALQWAA